MRTIMYSKVEPESYTNTLHAPRKYYTVLPTRNAGGRLSVSAWITSARLSVSGSSVDGYQSVDQ